MPGTPHPSNGLRELVDSEAHVGQVGGHTVAVAATLTRPGDATPYAANDAVTNSTSAPSPIEFPLSARVDGGSGLIVGARLTKSTNVVAAAQFRLWLYSATPSGTPNDNAAFAQAWANRDKRIGYVDFLSPVAGADCFGTLSAQPMPFKLASGQSLYGIIQALAGYTPGNAENLRVELAVCQD
jgi:hypothetical protein